MKVWDPALKTEMGTEGSGDVLPFTMSALPPEASESVLPATVTADPPGRTLWPWTTKPEGAGVSVWPAIVRMDIGGSGSGDVLPLTMSASSLGARATVVPLTMAALPPALMMSPLTRVTMEFAGRGFKGMVLLAMMI